MTLDTQIALILAVSAITLPLATEFLKKYRLTIENRTKSLLDFYNIISEYYTLLNSNELDLYNSECRRLEKEALNLKFNVYSNFKPSVFWNVDSPEDVRYLFQNKLKTREAIINCVNLSINEMTSSKNRLEVIKFYLDVLPLLISDYSRNFFRRHIISNETKINVGKIYIPFSETNKLSNNKDEDNQDLNIGPNETIEDYYRRIFKYLSSNYHGKLKGVSGRISPSTNAPWKNTLFLDFDGTTYNLNVGVKRDEAVSFVYKLLNNLQQ